jgi:hypothetical protein
VRSPLVLLRPHRPLAQCYANIGQLRGAPATPHPKADVCSRTASPGWRRTGHVSGRKPNRDCRTCSPSCSSRSLATAVFGGAVASGFAIAEPHHHPGLTEGKSDKHCELDHSRIEFERLNLGQLRRGSEEYPCHVIRTNSTELLPQRASN